MKTTSSEHVVYINCFECQNKKTMYVHNMFRACSFLVRTGKSMNNLLSYCGLIDARIRASEKDLSVPRIWTKIPKAAIVYLAWLFLKSLFIKIFNLCMYLEITYTAFVSSPRSMTYKSVAMFNCGVCYI